MIRKNAPFKFILFFIMLQLMVPMGMNLQAQVTAKKSTEKSAHEVLQDLHVQTLTFEGKPQVVKDGVAGVNKGILTFGAEKEGIDLAIANFMGPNAERFKDYFVNIFGKVKMGRRPFLEDFVIGLINGEFRDDSVRNNDGVVESKINFSHLNNYRPEQIRKMADKDLIYVFKSWLNQTYDRPFSFLKPTISRAVLGGRFPLGRDNFSKYIYSMKINTSEDHEDPESYKKSKIRHLTKLATLMDLEKNITKNDQDNEETLHEKRIQALKAWFSQSGRRPFENLSSEARLHVLNWDFQGSSYASTRSDIGYKFKDWVPHFGLPSKYIYESEPAADYIHRHAGWEMKFNILNSYAEKEKFLEWFKKTARSDEEDNLYTAPGHQRIVWPQPARNQDKIFPKIAELFKNYQAYIILRGIVGKTGIIGAKWKDILKQEDIAKLETFKGVIRLEKDRWAPGTLGVEVRSATKDAEAQQFIDKTLIARAGTNEWSDISKGVNDWTLIPDHLIIQELKSALDLIGKDKSLNYYSSKLKISKADLRRFFTIIKTKFKPMDQGPKLARPLHVSHLAPLWNWDEAPYLGADKKEIVKQLSRDFIYYILRKGRSTKFDDIQAALQIWAKATRIDKDIEDYLTPKKQIDDHDQIHQFVAETNGKKNPYEHKGPGVDVNKIDIGIEYSAKLPIYSTGEFLEGEKGEKKAWVDATFNLTTEERKNIIRNVAISLGKNLGSKEDLKNLISDQEKEELKKKAQGIDDKEKGHGHGLGVSFTVTDKEGREWRVEWDGIQREYDHQGNIIDGTTRGGVIELVTPKFVPKIDEMKKVFAAFREHSAIPNIDAGGGHINIDLAPFKGRPEAFARFLSVFHKHRNVMSMMFQSSKRVKTAAPVDLSDELHEKLKNFKGSEKELKQLLYNEHYFNDRMGRKTRYLQLDISSYFQDVIPAEYITRDFDILNPNVLWRQEFRVSPKARKMEFRMMDAPRDAFESSMQLKLVRAMLSKALNETTPIEGQFAKIDYEKYVAQPQVALKELKSMTDELGLNFDDYKGFLAERISKHKAYMQSKLFSTIEEKLKSHQKLAKNKWKKALAEERALEGAPNAKDIEFEHLSEETKKEMTLPEAITYRNSRLAAAKKADEIRLKKAAQIENKEQGVCLRRNIDGFGVNHAEVKNSLAPLLEITQSEQAKAATSVNKKNEKKKK